jgi:hypothetical protein
MRVKSLVDTGKLIKGAIYDVYRLQNVKKNSYYTRGYLTIQFKNGKSSTFTVHNFTMEDGSSIPEINWVSDSQKSEWSDYETTKIKQDNIKKGDFVVYNRNISVNLIRGKKYLVTDVKTQKQGSWINIHIKVEGSNRFYQSYNFRKCTVAEIREMSLNSILSDDNKIDVEIIEKGIRKIDKLSKEKKEKELIRVLLTSMADPYRHNLSVIEWSIKKTGKNYKLNENDFNEVLKLTTEELINKYQ